MNILIIDDNKLIADLMVDVLSSNNFKAQSLTDSREAISIIKSTRPDVILLDIMMPGIDGVTLCKMIKSDEEIKYTKVIMLTCKDFIADREKAKSVGADGFLNKATKPDDIIRAINEITSGEMFVRFWGTRGSLPTPDMEMMVYGGDTSCVELRLGKRIIILDAGTGIRKMGDYISKEIANVEDINMFLSHFHWDHIQGFPFFTSIYDSKLKIKIYGCQEADLNVDKVLETQMGVPYFPIPLKHLSANLTFFSITEEKFNIDDIVVKTMYMNHPGNTLGFRVEWKNRSVVYMPDNELSEEIASHKTEHDEKVIDFCKNANVLIHDSQYTTEEYQHKKKWGHSSYVAALNLAMLSETNKFYLFHHDPMHTDAQMDDISDKCNKIISSNNKLTCQAAKQGDTIKLTK